MLSCNPEQTGTDLEADVFDRASLQFTVKLIRDANPSLALRVQNIFAPDSSLVAETMPVPRPGDLFRLDLDSYTLRRVMETLADAAQEIAQSVLLTRQGNEEFLLLTRDVIGKWFLYARHHRDGLEQLVGEAG